MSSPDPAVLLALIAKHRRHVEFSLGAGASECRYAVAVLDDVEADLLRALAAPQEPHLFVADSTGQFCATCGSTRFATHLAVPQETPHGEPCVIGRYCTRHEFIHGGEAEELRLRIEEALKVPDDPGQLGELVQRVLDDVDARDALAYIEANAAASPTRDTP